MRATLTQVKAVLRPLRYQYIGRAVALPDSACGAYPVGPGERGPAMVEGHWHFQCPTCGMGSFELGRLAADQELVCEVCGEEGRGEIRLERWIVAAPKDEARLPADLAA